MVQPILLAIWVKVRPFEKKTSVLRTSNDNTPFPPLCSFLLPCLLESLTNTGYMLLLCACEGFRYILYIIDKQQN